MYIQEDNIKMDLENKVRWLWTGLMYLTLDFNSEHVWAIFHQKIWTFVD